ncbi:MAG: hypothetical protein ABW068_03325 [Candidatus Thiodiazotropha sp.]
MQEKRQSPRKVADQILDVSDQITGNQIGRVVNISAEGFMLLSEEPVVTGSVYHKRVFDLMKDFGTSKSTKIDSIFDSLLVPRPSRSLTLRDDFASSSPLRCQLPNDWTSRSDAIFGSPLAPTARRVSSIASRLPGTTSLRFAFPGWQRLKLEISKAQGDREPIKFGAEAVWCTEATQPNSYWSGFHIIDIDNEDVLSIDQMVLDWYATED